MKRSAVLIGITCVLLAGSIFGSWYVMHCQEPQKIAKIYQGDTLLYQIDLSSVEESYEITIDGENGAQNMVLVEPGAISMESATCPDGLCVHQGTISDGILPIICLPNHIRISIVSEGDESYDVQVY